MSINIFLHVVDPIDLVKYSAVGRGDAILLTCFGKSGHL